jgi:hypothetical protein
MPLCHLYSNNPLISFTVCQWLSHLSFSLVFYKLVSINIHRTSSFRNFSGWVSVKKWMTHWPLLIQPQQGEGMDMEEKGKKET